MSGQFIVRPPNGRLFDTDEVRELLCSHAATVEEPRNPGSYVFAGDRQESLDVVAALQSDPETPHWVVFVSASPEAIVVYCEAGRDILEAFRPLLERLLATLPHGRVTDEEGRPLEELAPPDMAKYLLQ